MVVHIYDGDLMAFYYLFVKAASKFQII